MSFILDALKKSETERQRQSGPALFEVKVAPPRGRFAVWAIGLGALLAINLVVVGWMMLRGAASRSTAVAAQESAPAPGPPLVSSTNAFRPLTVAPGSGAAAPAPAPAGSPGAASGGTAAPRGIDTRFGVAAPTANAGSVTAAGAPSVAASPPGTDAGAPPPTAADDLAPAVEPPRQAESGSGGVVRATDSGLPTYQDAAATPGANLPDLHLDLNAYSPQPDQSFVFLNMMKLHEGDALPTGVRVERILRDGVILSYHGTKFVLQTNP